MPERLKTGNKVVGTRRVTKALEAGRVAVCYLAQDADLFIATKIRGLCEEKRVKLVEVSTMKQLGQACGVEVPTASAGLLL
ncbi:MAG: ribosomal L7Ae/L30e/S12e/Gadd45 family protein [Clostridia bacterium]|nr:ribosomal L7Ae/L30e/S12e/Gadd45 family protein [Clostridia bacterium]